MKKTLAEISEFVGGEVVGNGDLIITGICGIKEAKEGDLTFVANSKYFSLLDQTSASAIITPRGMNVPGKSIIRTDNPSLAFASIITKFIKEKTHLSRGIHKTAIIADDAHIGRDVSIGPYTVIDQGASIGDHSIIYSGCYIGYRTTIGENCLIYPNVMIREEISIGNRVIINGGAVIGSDGFGFINVNGVHEKIPQIGTVVIEDDVEIGANVTIDRARFDKTFIGRGTKIDNLVQIAHNVVIGEDCIIVAQVGISGSSHIKKKVTLAGQSGIAGHLTVGEGAVVASQSGVVKS